MQVPKSKERVRSEPEVVGTGGGGGGGSEMIGKGASKIQGDMKLAPKNLCSGKAL